MIARDRMIPVAVVAEWTGLSKSKVIKMEREAEMPAAVRLGRSVRWRESTIAEWIAQGCPSQSREPQEVVN